jgi:hypothetical protein
VSEENEYVPLSRLLDPAFEAKPQSPELRIARLEGRIEGLREIVKEQRKRNDFLEDALEYKKLLVDRCIEALPAGGWKN